jgi:hypothetical protein
VTSEERHAREAARLARRWQLYIGIAGLVGSVVMARGLQHPQPLSDLADQADRALWEMRRMTVLMGAVTTAVRLATAFGIGRLQAWAWWTAASSEVLFVVAGIVMTIAMHLGIPAVVVVALTLVQQRWTFRRLFDRRLVRWFNPGRGAQQVAGPDPRFQWDAATPLPPGGRVLEGYVPSAVPATPPPPVPRPAPSGSFDYFA